MNTRVLNPRIAATAAKVVAAGVAGLALMSAGGHGKPTLSSGHPQSAGAELRELRGAINRCSNERAYFALAERTLRDGYLYRSKPPTSGYVVAYHPASPKFFALAGECYGDALALVKKRRAAGLPVSKASMAEAVARDAWWHARNARHAQYRAVVADIHRALRLDPKRAIYWAMLADATWRQMRRPCTPQWSKAVGFLKRAIYHNPKCAVAYWMLAQLMASGPHYNVMNLRSDYDPKACRRYDRLCYVNRNHMSRSFFYYSDFRVRDEIWNVMQGLGIAPPNSVPPKGWRVAG